MKKAYIISTGTELILGTTIDTNSVFLSERLTEIGIKTVGKSTVGDSRNFIKKAFEFGLESADIVIASGGLGPTFDDLTKEVACEVMGVEMEIIDEELTRLKEFFTSRKRVMPECNIKQAMFPREANILRNPLGTAPGMYLSKEGKVVILLPGPPRETTRMFDDEVVPLLTREFNLETDRACRKTVKVFGPGESQVEEMLAEIMQHPRGCTMALLAKEGEIQIKITAEGKDSEHSRQIMSIMTDQIKEKLGSYIYGYDEDTLPSVVASLLLENNKSAAIAESCTGGLVSKMITDLPGSSQYFWGSVTSYSNEAKKVFLNVKEEILEHYGAVSEETAVEMVRGIVAVSGADIGAAITGIAGPGGGSEEKPVGLVYIAVGNRQNVQVKKLRFVGNREAVRTLAAKTALDLIRRYLMTGGKE